MKNKMDFCLYLEHTIKGMLFFDEFILNLKGNGK
jgi:hypothetical protein